MKREGGIDCDPFLREAVASQSSKWASCVLFAAEPACRARPPPPPMASPGRPHGRCKCLPRCRTRGMRRWRRWWPTSRPPTRRGTASWMLERWRYVHRASTALHRTTPVATPPHAPMLAALSLYLSLLCMPSAGMVVLDRLCARRRAYLSRAIPANWAVGPVPSLLSRDPPCPTALHTHRHRVFVVACTRLTGLPAATRGEQRSDEADGCDCVLPNGPCTLPPRPPRLQRRRSTVQGGGTPG